MKFNNIHTITFFIFFVWFEIIIFSIALIGGNIFCNFIFYILQLLIKKDIYVIAPELVNSIKLMTIFGLISAMQYFFISFLMRIVKNKLSLMIYFFSICVILTFIINKLLHKTAFKVYSFLWLGFLISFILGSYELFLANKRFFYFNIRK